MGTVNAIDPQTNNIFSFANTGDLDQAIKSYGYKPVHADGSPFVVNPFAGGYLLDGAPINVYIEGRWFDGQKELLQPEWAAGRIPTPSAAVLAVGTVPMPPDVQANYDAYVSSQSSIFGSIPTPVLLAVGGLLAWKFLK